MMVLCQGPTWCYWYIANAHDMFSELIYLRSSQTKGNGVIYKGGNSLLKLVVKQAAVNK